MLNPKVCIFFVITVFLCLFIYIYLAIFSSSIPEKDLRAQYLEGGDFQLFYNDDVFSLDQVKGTPSILYFGYTYCPDVCPVGLALIRDVLNSDQQFAEVSAMFVTVDPVRDSAEKLKEYATFFHPNILPLRGSVEEIQKIIGAYGGFFRKITPDNPQDQQYLVDHSAYYYLLGSDGELMRVFDHSVSKDELASALRSLL